MSNTSKRAPEMTDVDEQIKAIRNDVADLTRLLKELAESKASAAGKAFENEAEDLKHRAQEAAEDVARRARSAASSIEEQILEKPIQSTLIALLVGFLIGSLGRR
jgi:ElaB/YqjD/DUF883 family membrane-anchored ribosome-binding protein